MAAAEHQYSFSLPAPSADELIGFAWQRAEHEAALTCSRVGFLRASAEERLDAFCAVLRRHPSYIWQSGMGV